MVKKLKPPRMGAGDSRSRSHVDPRPPVDVNKPVTNPNLVVAMKRLKNDQSDEAKDAILQELNRANFLVAIFDDEIKTTEHGDGKATIEKGSVIKVLNTSDPQGNVYLPLFTDWDALRKYIDKPVSALIFPSQDAWHWALKMGDYRGVVINPAEDALELSRAQIEYLANQSSANKGIETDAD